MTTIAAEPDLGARDDLRRFRRTAAERLIAGGRILLVASALLAVWLDPTEPTRNAEATYALCVAYLAYSLLVGVLVWLEAGGLRRIGVVTHVVDLLVFTALLCLTDGPASSPFFTYFTFSVLSASLRWRLSGTLWTTLAALFAFNAVGLYFVAYEPTPHLELNRYLIRSVYLLVIAALVGYLGTYHERRHGDIAKLVHWSRGGDDADAVRRSLAQAAAVFDAETCIALWEEAEEPWQNVARYGDGRLERWREAPGRPGAVAAGVPPVAFLCDNCAAAKPTLIGKTRDGLARWRGHPLEPEFQRRFAVAGVLAAPFEGAHVRGQLLVPDPPRLATDDLDLVELVAHRVAADLDDIVARRSRAQTAGERERVRLGRELHDGVLQALAGIGLQLSAIRRSLASDLKSAENRLMDLESLVVEEQRDLRFFIQSMRAVPIDPARAEDSLMAHLRELGKRIEAYWNLKVAIVSEGFRRPVPPLLAESVYRLVQEALANAARHARACRANVTVGSVEDGIRIAVFYDGQGFDFRGRFDLQALSKTDQGPVSLRERVTYLSGSLEIDSAETETQIRIGLPLRPAEASAS
jgi:signal transduction histidine kinase